MTFLDACELIYKGIIRGGHPGIIAAGDTENVWVFSPAPKKIGEMEYGNFPFFINKTTGEISRFSPTETEDWEILDRAKEINVPEQFRPKYN